MAGKADALKSSLLQAGFAPLDAGGEGSIQAVLSNLSNPSVVVPMVLDIREIDAYEFNPRRERNPRYDEIKASIRESGLDNPLPVSRIGTEGHYFIYKGGNTRRAVLLDLVLNEGREDLAAVQCYFHPFEGHIAAMAAHHRENGTRGDMSFIDNALGIMRIRRELEVECGEKLSLRALECELKERGLGGSAGHLSKMEYAVTLLAFIPEALRAGMGSDQTARLRKLETAALSVTNHWRVQWQGGEALEEEVFRTDIFGVALSLTDKPVGWQYDEAQVMVCGALQEQGVVQAVPWLNLVFTKKPLPLPPVVDEVEPLMDGVAAEANTDEGICTTKEAAGVCPVETVVVGIPVDSLSSDEPSVTQVQDLREKLIPAGVYSSNPVDSPIQGLHEHSFSTNVAARNTADAVRVPSLTDLIRGSEPASSSIQPECNLSVSEHFNDGIVAEVISQAKKECEITGEANAYAALLRAFHLAVFPVFVKETHGNLSKIARLAGISRETIRLYCGQAGVEINGLVVNKLEAGDE